MYVVGFYCLTVEYTRTGDNGSQMEYMDLNHSADTLLFTLGQVVLLPQPLKDKQFFKMFKSAENGHI